MNFLVGVFYHVKNLLWYFNISVGDSIKKSTYINLKYASIQDAFWFLILEL